MSRQIIRIFPAQYVCVFLFPYNVLLHLPTFRPRYYFVPFACLSHLPRRCRPTHECLFICSPVFFHPRRTRFLSNHGNLFLQHLPSLSNHKVSQIEHNHPVIQRYFFPPASLSFHSICNHANGREVEGSL